MYLVTTIIYVQGHIHLMANKYIIIMRVLES
jgi:hypothetical protein